MTAKTYTCPHCGAKWEAPRPRDNCPYAGCGKPQEREK